MPRRDSFAPTCALLCAAALAACAGPPPTAARALGASGRTPAAARAGSAGNDSAMSLASDAGGAVRAAEANGGGRGLPTDAAADAGAAAAADAAADGAAPGAAASDVAPLDEAELRTALANDPDPTAAALTLADWLGDVERHREALVVLDTALARGQGTPLRLARADVLRDLGQRHLAVQELRALRQELGAAAVPPQRLWELARLEWIEGEHAAATATLAELRTAHARDPWLAANADACAALADELARGAPPTRVEARDLLGNLRGAPLASERLAVLDQLAAAAPGADARRRALRERAIAIALGDPFGPIRARAVRLVEPEPDVAAALIETSLADDDPLVRQAGAARADALLGRAAFAPLLARLATESHPATFRAVHAALARASGVDDDLDAAAATTVEGRAEVVARWRARPRP